MKYRELKENEQLQIDDIVVHLSCFGNSKFPVHRLTGKHAWVKYNENCQGKYPLIYDRYFCSLPKQRYSMVQYKVYRAVPEFTK
jgi:hypothetical protein